MSGGGEGPGMKCICPYSEATLVNVCLVTPPHMFPDLLMFIKIHATMFKWNSGENNCCVYTVGFFFLYNFLGLK